MSYVKEFEAVADEVRKLLSAKKVPDRLLNFSPDPDEIPERIWAPSQAMTKFPMEQALGDWAENVVRAAIDTSPNYKAIPFGDNDKTLSEDQTFSELYRTGKRREYAFGKRSDLLLFSSAAETPDDASLLNGEEAEALCRECLAAIEVRSSRTSSDKFIEYNLKQKEAGKRPARMEPSFTVKTEDLSKVYRWIARNNKPVVYVQVFFDNIFALNFIDAFRFIVEKGSRVRLENPGRSGKATIFIPISRGRNIGSITIPTFEIVHNAYENGRHDIFGKPIDGKAIVKMEELLAVL